MTSTAIDFAEYANTERQMLENIHTLMLRAKVSGRGLAEELGLGRGLMARRLAGDGSFYYLEVRAIARYFGVTFEELEGQLPSYEEWRARRDSNPKPSDMERGALHLVAVAGGLSVKPTLTLNRQTATHHPSCPARDGSGACIGCGRHLSVVA